MGIQQGTHNITEMDIGSKSVSEVYCGSTKIFGGALPYPLESIVTRQKADSNGKVWIGTSGSSSFTKWKITIDDTVVWDGTGTAPQIPTFSGYTADSEHIVMIEPLTIDWKRARSYTRSTIGQTGKATLIEIIQDLSYIGFAASYMNNTTFRQAEYQGCVNLINTAPEYMPDEVTDISDNFRRSQYEGCTSLTETAVEVLPSGITTVGKGYRHQQYKDCTSLTNIKGLKEVTAATTPYRTNQFSGCTSNKVVKVLTDVGVSAYDQNTLANDYVTQVKVPSAYLQNFKNATVYPRVGIDDSKFVGV